MTEARRGNEERLGTFMTHLLVLAAAEQVSNSSQAAGLPSLRIPLLRYFYHTVTPNRARPIGYCCSQPRSISSLGTVDTTPVKDIGGREYRKSMESTECIPPWIGYLV